MTAQNTSTGELSDINASFTEVEANLAIQLPQSYVSEKELKSFISQNLYCTKDIRKANKAIKIAKEIHNNHKRRNGERFLEGHVYPVTKYSIENVNRLSIQPSCDFVIVAILHDTLEDANNPNAQELILKTFGQKILFNVQKLTKPRKISRMSIEQKYAREAEYVDKILECTLECKVIKCSDRILNVTDDVRNLLNGKSNKFIRDYKIETQEHYLKLFIDTKDEAPFLLKKIHELINFIDAVEYSKNIETI